MKLSIQKSHIVDVLSKVQGLTGRKSNLAITSNVLIRTAESGICLIATDLETGFEGTYPASVDDGGAIAINARKLFEIVRDFPDEDIHINEVENHWIEIGNAKVEYHIVGMNPDDFPEIPRIAEIPFFEVDSNDFKKMIEKSVVISGTADDQRAHLIGVLLETVTQDDVKILRVVSTDGFRLSKTDIACENAAELPTEKGILIPKKGLTEVNKFLETQGNVSIGIKENHFVVKRPSETLLIRLLEGDFPEYTEIVMKKGGHDIRVDNQMFTMMLRRMSILSSESYKAVKFCFSENMLLIESTNPDIGESKEEMSIKYSGQAIEATFNPRYFIDALNLIEEETAIMNIVDEEKPCLLEGENDKRFLSVIMPMRL